MERKKMFTLVPLAVVGRVLDKYLTDPALSVILKDIVDTAEAEREFITEHKIGGNDGREEFFVVEH